MKTWQPLQQSIRKMNFYRAEATYDRDSRAHCPMSRPGESWSFVWQEKRNNFYINQFLQYLAEQKRIRAYG